MKHGKTRTLTDYELLEAMMRVVSVMSMLDHLLGRPPASTEKTILARLRNWTGCADVAEFEKLVRTEAGLRRVLLNFGRTVVAELGPAD